jgi:hypothetical protein
LWLKTARQVPSITIRDNDVYMLGCYLNRRCRTGGLALGEFLQRFLAASERCHRPARV